MANVIIHGGTFNSAQGDFHINNKDSGLRDLRPGVSLGAIHDSAERSPAPNCHPDTRKTVRQIILDWIHCEISALSVFWLYGPAGAGKTSILQAIAEFLCSRSGSGQNLFGGSFFFSRGKQGRDQGRFLFPTIAYQLALKVPGLRQHVNRIMELDPTLHTKSMDVQLQTLIVDAFQQLSPPPPHFYLVIIDGLDECHDKATQQSILQLLCETVTVHKLPLRFLIGCRPESHIRASFDQESLYTITHRVVLDENFNPGRDICVFLEDGFAKICAGNPILSHVEQPWPSEGIIDLLVQRSSGQFIYAATVLKFVGADFCNPTKQLALVLKPDPSAFSDLDQLYTQILSVFPSETNIVKVLGIISVSHGESTVAMEDIFGMEEGELELVLRGLSSLMKDETRSDKDGESSNEEVISYIIPHFAHASFSDYLFDSSRSGPFHVNRQEYNENQVILRSFALIIQSIRSWGKSSNTWVIRTATWKYLSLHHLSFQFRQCPKAVKEAIMTDINDLVQDFWRISSDGVVGTSLFAMRRLHGILQVCSQKNLLHESIFDFVRSYQVGHLLDGYRKMLDQSLSKSKDLGDFLRYLRGIVVQKDMSMQGMADLYRIKPDLLERFVKSIEPLKLSYSSSRYILDDYLSVFLQNPDRSQLYYCDPILQHVSICRHFLSFLKGSNTFDFQSHELSDYVHNHFYDHLCAATTVFKVFIYEPNISDNHPALEILHDLETTPYFVDKNWSVYILKLAREIIWTILRWADMLNCHLQSVAVSVSTVGLKERVCHLTYKIYREMLCITINEGMTYITMGDLDHNQVSAFSWTPQYRIVLSWDLLRWVTMEGKIPRFFTNFITTPELSGPFHISLDIYHTQITEYLLMTIYQHSQVYRGWDSDESDRLEWSFREHLSRALPTGTILYLLRKIPSEYLTCGYFAESMLEIIIKWLLELGSDRPSDLYDRFQGELRHKNTFPQV